MRSADNYGSGCSVLRVLYYKMLFALFCWGSEMVGQQSAHTHTHTRHTILDIVSGACVHPSLSMLILTRYRRNSSCLSSVLFSLCVRWKTKIDRASTAPPSKDHYAIRMKCFPPSLSVLGSGPPPHLRDMLLSKIPSCTALYVYNVRQCCDNEANPNGCQPRFL